MPDIAMCLNTKCPKGHFCYRLRAIPSDPWQAYSKFSPDPAGKCDNFEPIEEGDFVQESPVRHKPKKGKKY
jgi:hypothetical protein